MMVSLSIRTTTICNGHCKHCGVQNFARDYPGYHYTLGDLRQLINACKSDSVKFKITFLTGGEPMMWKNVVEGTKRMKNAGIFGDIFLQTNGLYEDMACWDTVAENVDRFWITRYKGNEDQIVALKERFGDKVFVTKRYRVHTISPAEPVEGTLPPTCVCKQYSVFADVIDVCGTVRSVASRVPGIDLEPYSTVVSPGFMKRLEEMDAPEKECTMCLANLKVRKQCPSETAIVR